MAQSPPDLLVSVIMIARNAADTIPLALASLRNQSYQNWECILINDASEDGTTEVIKAIDDPRIKTFHLETPSGRGAARAEALKRCRGQYLCSLDADDFYLTHTLAMQVEELEKHPEVAAVVGRLLLFDGLECPRLLGTLRGSLKSGRDRVSEQPEHLRFPFGALMFRRRIVGSHTFLSRWKYTEDREFFSRILPDQTVIVLKDFTYAYRWRFEAEKVLLGLGEIESLVRQRLRSHPISSLRLMLLIRLKVWLYRLLLRLGLWDQANRLRVAPPDSVQQDLFWRELPSEKLQPPC